MEAKKREKIWTLRQDAETSRSPEEVRQAVLELASDLHISPVFAELLYHRGFHTADQAQRFLRCEEDCFHDPFLMKDMDSAVERILLGLERHEKTVIYGDYDVDGVTAVSVLYLYLREKGADVDYYIPSRGGEGYGLSKGALDRIAADGTALIITVDTGITANEEADYAASLGLDMVITDHHECRPELPHACAVVNPHRPDCTYPFGELAGVGVVFKLVCGCETRLWERAGKIGSLKDCIRRVCCHYVDLTAIGTIADVMPIVGENRLIVSMGLRLITQTERKGLAALIDLASSPAGVRPVASQKTPKRKVTSSFIGYGIAPRINAAGRISSASKAVRLLLSEDDESAYRMAQELCDINRTRQVEENRIAEQVYKRIEESHDFDRDRIIVLADNGWQQGIIGIVSSRITERYGLPSILISFDGSTRGYDAPDDIGKGSGRSIKGLNLVEAMNYCEDLLVKYGGHELAAGLTIRREQVEPFRRRINEYAAKCLDEESLRVQLEADCRVEMSSLTMELARELEMLEPYGVANPTPAFVLCDATIQKIISISGGKHTKLLIGAGGQTIYGMYFGVPTAKLPFGEGDRVDILFNLDVNEYQNLRTLQMIIQDIRPSQTYHAYCAQMQRRFEEIYNGESFDREENVIPDRNDFALVYTVLRREYRLNHDKMSDKTLYSLIEALSPGQINYIKLQIILLVLHELKICGVERMPDGDLHFDVYFHATKTNLEKSSILHKLKSQCRNRAFAD